MSHYGSVEKANTYHLARGNEAWATASEPARLAALIRATSYIDGRYRGRFPGRKTGGRGQALEWPRLAAADASGEAIGDDEIPDEVEQATFEAALREVTSPGSLNPDYTAGTAIKRERSGVGPLEEEIEYAVPTTAEQARPVIGVVDDLLAGLLAAPSRRTGSTSFLVRA